MSKNRKILSIFLLLAVFSVFSGSEFLHNHTSSGEGKQCSACLLGKTLQSSDAGAPQVCITPFFFELIKFPANDNFAGLILPESLSGRSPPSLA